MKIKEKPWGLSFGISSYTPFYCSLYGPNILFCGSGTPLQSSCLEIPWTEEPGKLQSTGSLTVRHDWATSLSLFTFMHWRRKWQPTPVFLPRESQGWGSLEGCRLWVHTESDMTEVSSSSIIMKECWIVLIFSCTYCDDHIIFILHCVSVVCYIYWFV